MTGKVAIITGGTVGIGLSTALLLAKEGAHVVLVGRNQIRLQEALALLEAQEPSPAPLGMLLDVRKQEDMQLMAHKTRNHFGRIDILVTAAGILRASAGRLRTVSQMLLTDWHEVIETNLKGVFLANRAVIPTMLGQGSGDIVNLSSTSGRSGLAFDAAYCASKFAVIGLSESLAKEVGPNGIRVQTILPGAIATGMWDQNGPLPPPPDIIPPERVASFILHALTLPPDTILDAPVIEPLKRHDIRTIPMDQH
jgi:NAD(P)-dependent dehydrogenase (short-subunit alcohol dehydrogenase family)